MQNQSKIGTGLYLGDEITEFMNRNEDLTTEQFGFMLGVTQSMVSKWRTNKAPMVMEFIPRLFTAIEGYDGSDELVLKILNMVTDGFIPSLPDEHVVNPDLNALSSRVVAEIGQVLKSIDDSKDEFWDLSSPSKTEALRDPEMLVKQACDLIRYLWFISIRVSSHFGFSVRDEFKAREKESIMAHEALI